jgi:hypothetical protein
MVQLYSDKTLLNMKNVQCHPVRFTLMNIAYSKRVLNHVDVAYLPSIEWPAGQENAVPEDVQRLARRWVVGKCLSMLLAPLKEFSKSGVILKDPWGHKRTVFTYIHTYVADDPEAKMVCGIKSSSNPCEICLAPDTELNAWVQGDQLVDYDRRYEKDQQRILEGIRGNPKAQGQHSTAAVASPLWGFMYGQEKFGSSTQCFPVEVMHVKDLGVFPDIIALIKPFLSLSLSDRQCAAALRDINARMREMPRAHDFGLPFCDGKYVPDHSRVQAKEHRNVMQILAFMLQGYPELQRVATA